MGKERRISYSAVIIALIIFLMAGIIISINLGRYPIGIGEIFGILWNCIADKISIAGNAIGISLDALKIEPFWQPVQESLFLQHRLPRVLIACMVGCSLSAAGAAYQGVFQNPMAAPDILGASSGAAFGAALAIFFSLGKSMIVVMAFISSILTVAAVIYTGNHARGKRVLGLILSGIMISSLVSSGTSFIKMVADPEDQLPAITYWLMGSLNGTNSKDVMMAFFPMFIGLIPLYFLSWRINLLTLGDEEAHTMGINVKKLRIVLILCATLVTAASVAVSGVIGWIGLVVPHLCRRLVGNNYKKLMPAAMLFGALFLLIVDDVSRNFLTSEIPIGILTSFIGAPFFVYLITRGVDR